MDQLDFDAITLDALRAGGGLKWNAFPDCIGAFVAEMDFGLAPEIRQALHASIDAGQVGYLSTPPLRVLAEACADWQRRRHGWAVDPATVRAVPDVLGALEIVLRHYLPAGVPVAVPTPNYMPFLPMLQLLGNPAIHVPMQASDGQWRLDEDALDAAFAAGARLLILCNPHNPLGKVYTRAELEGIARIVGRHGGRVFSDEIHAPLVFSGQRHVPYAALGGDAAAQAITAVSASKAWNLAGLKCAQMIFSHAPDLQRWQQVGLLAGHSTATPGVVAHTVAWRHGEAWLQHVLAYLEGNRALLDGMLRTRLPPLAWTAPDGTYLAWIDCRALDLPSSPAAFFRRHARVALTDGADCGPGGAGHVRLNFAMPRPLLREALERMADALATRR